MGKAWIDFAKLRETVTLEQVAEILQLKTKPSGKNLRADCPFCEAKGALYLNIAGHPDPSKKGLWYAHCCSTPGNKVGGDAIGLYATAKGLGQNEAAHSLAQHFNVEAGKRPDVRPDKDEMKPLDYLVPDHEACIALGLSKDLCLAWGGGFAPRGTMSGSVAIPVSQNGKLLGYVGYKKGEPMKKNKSIPDGVIFNGDRATNDEPLHVASDPLSAILALDNGVPNVVSFLGETGIHDLAALVLLMKEKSIAKYEIL